VSIKVTGAFDKNALEGSAAPALSRIYDAFATKDNLSL